MDALALSRAYGHDVAAYVAGAQGPWKVVELSGFVLFPLVLYLLPVPGGAERPALRNVSGAAIGACGLIALSHGGVGLALVLGGANLDRIWSWGWRLFIIALVSCAAELGLIGVVFRGTLRLRWLALLLVLGVSLAGGVMRSQSACGVPVLPACVDASLLTGRPGEQVRAAVAALAWLGAAGAALTWTRKRSERSSDPTILKEAT